MSKGQEKNSSRARDVVEEQGWGLDWPVEAPEARKGRSESGEQGGDRFRGWPRGGERLLAQSHKFTGRGCDSVTHPSGIT